MFASGATDQVALTNKTAWESSVSLGLTLTRGNSDTLLFTAGAVTDKKTPDNEFKLGADAAYGENRREKRGHRTRLRPIQ